MEEMLHISLMNGEARALLCESTQMGMSGSMCWSWRKMAFKIASSPALPLPYAPQIVTPQGYGVDTRVCISTVTVTSSPSAAAFSNIYASTRPDMIRATSS